MPVRQLIGRSLGELASSNNDKRSVSNNAVDSRRELGTEERRTVPAPTPVFRLKDSVKPDDSDDDNDGVPDGSDSDPNNPSITKTVWVTATMTVGSSPTQAAITGAPASSTALQRGLATQSSASAASTVIIPVALPPPPPMGGKDGGKNYKDKAVSDQTEDILIAAGSITGTIMLVVFIYIYIQFRKGKSWTRILKGRRAERDNDDDLRGPGGRTWSRPSTWVKPSYTFDPKNLPKPGDSTPTRSRSIKELPFPPTPILVRQATNSSNRPLLQEKRSMSFRESVRSPSSVHSSTKYIQELPASFPEVKEDSAPQQLPAPHLNPFNQNPPTAPPSVVASSRALPNNSGQPMHSSHPSQATSDSQTFIYGTQNDSQSRQTLPKISRFSWTNSQAPQTPRDARDPHLSRVSVATSTDSIPRFRTVESWVSQQAGRYAERSIKDYFVEADTKSEAGTEYSRQRSTSTLIPPDEQDPFPQRFDQTSQSSVPTVPQIPSHLKHERAVTQASDATVFRQHPGTEIVIPRGSRVPSEVLDKLAGPAGRGMI